MIRRLVALCAGAVLGAALVVGAPGSATAATGYCSGSGVDVVVDFGSLGGGLHKACDDSGNHNAADAFRHTGFSLKYAQREPGFVCRVDNVPASDPCVNTSPSDAYWGLYVGKPGGSWKFASVGVDSLDLSEGETVAFSWQGGSSHPPGAAPAARVVASPTPSPTHEPSPVPKPREHHGRDGGAIGTSPTPSMGASPSAAPTSTSTAARVRAHHHHRARTKSAAPTPSATASAGSAYSSTLRATSSPTDSSGGDGLPWWAPVAAVVVLAAGGIAIAVRRRTGAG